MPTVTLPHGEVHYRDTGPLDPPTSPPVVFVHGILVDSQMWSEVASRLAAEGVRSLAPDLPLGRTHAPGRRHRRPVATRRRPPSDRVPRAPRPHRRHARRQRHRRRDLPVPARHRRVADRPARADELRLLRPVPTVVAAALHGGDATTRRHRRRRSGDAIDDVPPRKVRLWPVRSRVRRGDDAGVDRAAAHRRPHP